MDTSGRLSMQSLENSHDSLLSTDQGMDTTGN